MTIDIKPLAGFPFNLDADAIAWVEQTLAGLSQSQKIGQILLPVCRDLSAAALAPLIDMGVGGLHRFPSRPMAELRASAAFAQSRAAIPLLMSADLELSEKASMADGTRFPNQMAVAAGPGADGAWRMGRLIAREGGFAGLNVSWTPVADLAVNPRANVVNTRAFGSDAGRVAELVTSYLDGAGQDGFATCVKHWPGDGLDDRDQHFATTCNSLSMADWRGSFGRVYAAAFAAGARVVMAGHITLPAYTRALGTAAQAPEWMPATLNPDLTRRLLRAEMGYNGLVVSDASGMVGFQARGPRSQTVPACIESGCDILLFPEDVAADAAHLARGLETGLLSAARLDEATARVLILKASLGLHRTRGMLPPEQAAPGLLSSAEHRTWASQTAQAAVTVVKDTQALLPLDPARHRRVLLAELPDRSTPSGPLPPLRIEDLLTARGFQVTRYHPGMDLSAHGHDVGIYAYGEEGMSAKADLTPQWHRLHGNFPDSMDRLWFHMPTLWLSLGSPFLLYHMPECRTFINAYSAIPLMQEAAVDVITGRIPARGQSPVDATCGLVEALL